MDGTMDATRDRERLLAALPSLLRELANEGVVELEVSVGGASLYLRQRPGTVPASEPVDLPVTEVDEGLIAITTPLAGLFYRAASPDAAPYVREGDVVEPGQIVGLVEAMKVFNEIHAETGGIVDAILVESGQTVRSGQTLITLRAEPEASGPAPAA
jgi:acetyl-CoA carboxylase biotin carboxyl carrier protein